MIILNILDSIKTSQVVTLPGWCGDTVEFELKRPSILALAAAGAIPNPLMKTARKLFYSGINPDGGDLAEEGRVLLEVAKAALVKPSFDFYSGINPDGGDLAEEGRVLLEVAKAALVKPSFDQLEAAGIELTDEQLVAIFQYTQLGAKALDRFRQLPADPDSDIHGAEVSE